MLRPDDARGFTIIEVLIAFTVLLVGLVATLALVSAANGRGTAIKGREGATNLAREVSEHVRSLNYSELTPALLQTRLEAKPQLADTSTAAGWQISRRGFTFTVAATVCSIDAPGDQYGDHSAGGFCADSSGVDTDDATPEDLKRIVVTTSFSDRGRTISTQTTTTVNSTSQSSGLPVNALWLLATDPATAIAPSATEPVIGTPVSALIFRVTVPAKTAAVQWNVEGGRKTPDATRIDATTYQFTWPISGLSDGTYGISASAVNAKGEIGPAREIPVRLARNVPAAVTNLVGGYNSVVDAGTARTAVELTWNASLERNVEGYRVYRADGTLACPMDSSVITAATSCIDLAPPPPDTTTAAGRTYRVVALYRNAANVLMETAAAVRQADPDTWTTQTVVDNDRTSDFRLSNGITNTSSSCSTGSTTRRDMLSGADGAAGTMAGQGASRLFCSTAFAADVQRILASTATFKGYFTNVDDQCGVTVTLRKQSGGAAVTLATTSRVFNLSGTGEHTFPAMSVPETPLAAGDRLTLSVAYNRQGGCSSMTFRFGLSNGYNHGRLDGPVIRYQKTVNVTNTSRPNPVTGLTAAPQTDGTVRLTWTKPAAGGPAYSFYRIYRNGTNHTDRLTTAAVDATAGATVDSELVTGGAATYYVTAASENLAESTFSDPVAVP